METCSGGNRSLFVEEEVDFLSVCERIAHDIEEVVKPGTLLNNRQCQHLSSELLQTVENLRVIQDVVRVSRLTFLPHLRILYQCLEKAKLLVIECAEEDWTAMAVFQVRNGSAFEQILRDVKSCFDTTYVVARHLSGLIPIVGTFSDLSLASVFDIEGDQEDLRRRLERLASDSGSVKVFGSFFREHEAQKQYLARHLLRKFSCTHQCSLPSSSDVCKASLWEKEMEPPESWGNSTFLGAGSGASGVCSTQWLGVPCARKEFHGQASEVTFLKEASILSHLKHPHIVNFICCGNGEAKGDRFIAMELMEKSLFDVIEERKGVPFALPVAVDIIFQIAEGMRYLHGQGVAHRDLKPQNVVVNRLAFPHLMDQYYCVKLVDFGMSKTKVEVSKSNTISFRGIGTTRYRAPEVHPKAHLDKAQWFRVDVYSFAMTCAHVLSLKAPFEDMEQLSELYARLMEGERPQFPSGLPEALVLMLGECWDLNPMGRPSFGKIWERLDLLRFGSRTVDLTLRTPFLPVNFNFSKERLGSEMISERVGNSRKSRSLSTGQTSYYTVDTHFCDGDVSDSAEHKGFQLI